MSTANHHRPNIIFLMTDQHRWDALGVENPLVQTPNLDALARRGVRYRQAVCNVPMCVPSRHSMMLGLYGSQGGLRHNNQFCPTDDDLPLPVLPQRLHELGYQTAGFGKTHWYLSARFGGAAGTIPSRRGFEVRAHARGLNSGHIEPGGLAMESDIPEAFARLQAEVEPYGGGGENVLGYTGCTSAIPSEHHREGWLTDQALRWLDEGRDPDRPLFFYLSFDFPHAGLNVPAGYEDRYNLADIPDRPLPPWANEAEPPTHARPDHRREGWLQKSPQERRLTTLRYYALCTYVDDLFGRALQKLEAMGELENSFILFASDHGEMLGDRGHRFSKYCLYEGSVRVPLIVAGDAVPPEQCGTVDERPAELVDVLPTLLDVAGQTVPPQLPGRSLLASPCRRGTFAEMHASGYENLQGAPAYMWRTPDWKLILYFAGPLEDILQQHAQPDQEIALGELYNLQSDPHEWYNLYDDPTHLAQREQLTRELLLHLMLTWARYPYQASPTELVRTET